MKRQHEHMQCMEILGGNLATDRCIEAPGMDIYVSSSPHLDSDTGGGDIYYMTSCASGRITRMLLADVSGHGASASELAIALKDSLRKNVNRISQSRFVQDMNREFQKLRSADRFATAVVATYFEPQRKIAFALTGHPNPLVYRQAEQRWFKVDEQALRDKRSFRNMPFGVVDDSVYPTRKVRIGQGDMVLLYSDAFIESLNSESRQIGIDGVLDVLNGMPSSDPAEIIPSLKDTIFSWQPGNLKDDDATVMLGHFRGPKPRWRDTIKAPVRLLGKVKDKTRFA